jgi:hypothetical protein
MAEVQQLLVWFRLEGKKRFYPLLVFFEFLLDAPTNPCRMVSKERRAGKEISDFTLGDENPPYDLTRIW